MDGLRDASEDVTEAIGQPVEFIMPGYLRGRYRAAFAKAVKSVDEIANVVVTDAFATDKAGATFPVKITVSSSHRDGSRMFTADIVRRVVL